MALPYTFTTVSRVPSFASDGGLQFATKYLLQPGSAITAFMQLLAGGPALRGNRVIFRRPHADPECPWLRCTDITAEPLDDAYPAMAAGADPLQTPAFYDQMMVNCTYKTPKFDQGDEGDDGGNESDQGDEGEEIEIASNSWEYSAQAQKVPGQRLGWNDDVGDVTDTIDGLAQNSGQDQAIWAIP